MWEWCSKLLRQYLINQNQPKLYLIIREWTKNNFCSYTLTNPFMFMWLCCSHQMVQHVEHSGNVNKLKGISYLNSTGIPTQRFPVYRLIIFLPKIKGQIVLYVSTKWSSIFCSATLYSFLLIYVLVTAADASRCCLELVSNRLN